MSSPAVQPASPSSARRSSSKRRRSVIRLRACRAPDVQRRPCWPAGYPWRREQTGDALSVVELAGRRGDMPPLHIDHRDNETVYVVAGRMSWFVGDRHLALGEGQATFVPRGHSTRVPHRVRTSALVSTVRFRACSPGQFPPIRLGSGQRNDSLARSPVGPSCACRDHSPSTQIRQGTGREQNPVRQRTRPVSRSAPPAR